jgi:hypothetical protein
VEWVLGARLCSHRANSSRKRRYALGPGVLPVDPCYLAKGNGRSKTCLQQPPGAGRSAYVSSPWPGVTGKRTALGKPLPARP